MLFSSGGWQPPKLERRCRKIGHWLSKRGAARDGWRCSRIEMCFGDFQTKVKGHRNPNGVHTWSTGKICTWWCQTGVALGRWRPCRDVKVSGILFNPYTPVTRAFGFVKKLSAFCVGIRKRLQFRWMLSNSSVDRIYLLNDASMADKLNSMNSRRPGDK